VNNRRTGEGEQQENGRNAYFRKTKSVFSLSPRVSEILCVGHSMRKPYAPADRPASPIYTAPRADLALSALDAFERGEWGPRFPTIIAAWRRAWSRVLPFFAFPPEIRRVIYTTNALESVHARLRKILKTRGYFPNDEAATKLIWLALRNITVTWERAAPTWRQAMNQSAILYGERFLPPTT
jgi:transposase-like protein